MTTTTIQKTAKGIKAGILLTSLGFWISLLLAFSGIGGDWETWLFICCCFVGGNWLFRAARWWDHS